VACPPQGCFLNEVSEDCWSAMDILGYCWLLPVLCQAIVHRPSERHVNGEDGLDP
jgi:hypothetical protein